MEQQNTKSLEELEILVNHIISTHHRKSKKKSIGLFASAESDSASQIAALNLLLNSIQKSPVAPQDAVLILNLLQKCLKKLQGNAEVDWNKALETVGVFIRKQGLTSFLYEERSNIDSAVFEVLKCFPKETLANALKNVKDYATFHAVSKFLHRENELKVHKDTVLARLREEFLVDKSKLTTKITPYISKSILDDTAFEELLSTALKLIKRSESNIETLIVFLENISFDVSKRAFALIFEDLKDLVGAKEKEKIEKFHRALKAITQQTKDSAVLDKIFNELVKALNDNNQEPVKVSLIQMLCFMVKLGNKEFSQAWFKTLFGTILSSAGFLSSDESANVILEEIRKLREFLGKKENAVTLGLDDKDFANLKKHISNATINKNSFGIVSAVMTVFLEFAFEDEKIKKEFGALIEVAYQNQVTTTIKAIGKLVTAYSSFISTVINTSLYLNNTENAKLEKSLKGDLAAMLDENAFVTMQKFYGKANHDELANWLRVFSLNGARLSSALSYTDSKFIILCSSLTEAITHPLITTKDLTEFFRDLKDKDFTYYALVHGFFNKIYISTEAELERVKFDKMRIVLDHIIKDLESVTLTNELTLELFWLINCERLNSHLKLRTLLDKRTSKDGELKEKVNTAVQDTYDNLKGFLLSNNGLFNQDQNKSETAVNLSTMLINWGNYELLSEFQLFIKLENYTETAEIDKFEEESSSRSEFEGEISDYLKIINKLGITEAKPSVEETKTNTQAAPKGKAGKGPVKAPVGGAAKKGAKEPAQKPNPNQKYMDQEELLKLKQDELKKKMGGYLNVVGRVLKKVLRLRNTEATTEYFNRCHENLKELAQEETARGTVEGILYTLLTFSPYKPILRSADFIIRAYICKLSELEMDPDEITEAFINSFKNLKELDVAKIESHYANIIYDSCQYILVSENLDNRLKSNALAIIIKIGTTGDSTELGSEILQMMIDYLDNICHYPETQSLFAFLMEKFSDAVADSLFSYLLDYVDDAKILCLKTFVALNNPPLFSDFERNLKLKILALDENETIVKLSNECLEKYKLALKPEHIENFNLTDFVNAESNDSIEKFCKCTPEIVKEVPSSANTLIKKSIEAAEALANNKEIKKMEDALHFLPFLAAQNLPHVKEFLPKIFEIFVEQYCVEAYPDLMEKTLEVGTDIIKEHGSEKGDFILGVLEKYLDNKKYPAQVNVTAIILMGACAPYLKDKSKVKTICDKIISTANSPSDHVKKNIARCLPQLIGFFQNPQKIVQDLLESLQNEKDVNKMKGSAYLLSGFVKGLGVQYIQEFKIMDFLEQNVEGKKVSPNIKLAIIAVIQALTENLAKIFEPFFLKVLQVLMNFYGENQEEIRLASLRCTKTMMSYLSAFGVRQVLPQLLKGIEEKTWRAKVASISVLGNMAFCAPKQLSSCLPQIVPKLAQALSDPHPTVQEKGNLALKEIGSTIKSPEISDIADILIKALSNPYDENKKGLEVLLQTQFVHYIDTASLSLIIPIIEYGLRNRDSTLRKYASQLIGSISNLIKNTSDLDPYLNMLINALKMAICDTLSDVRAIAAKACGSLCQKLGLEKAAKLIISIQEVLESGDSNTIDRAGAAQAMSEITYALGKSYIDKVLPVYLANTTSNQIHIRESYIGIFAFLPAIMEDEFEPYISDVVDNIIDAISDEHENTRNLSIRVCKILIQRFGLKKTNILMDPAEAGLFSANWRRRNSSVILVGEMLEILQRCERKGLAKDVEVDYTEKYNRIVTSLHILKFDTSENVKHLANQIWKTFVENTPKTLKQILPMLIDKLIYIISEVEENVDMANTCIHEFGAKYAESMFRDIYSHLENYKKQHVDQSQNIKALCILLDTLIGSMPDDFVETRKDSILSLILDLLITSDDYIRESACQVLQTLLSKCRKSNLIEELVPNFFKELEKLDESAPEYDEYLKFFDEIIQFEVDTHLEYLGECLFSAPLTQFKLDIITNNAESFGPELYTDTFFYNVIDNLLSELQKPDYDEDLKQSIMYCINQLSIHLDESKLPSFFHSCYQLIEPRLLKDNKQKVYYGLEVLHFYFHNTSHDFYQYIGQILTNITVYFTSSDKKILGDINDILNSILNSLEQDKCFDIIKPFNQCIESALQLGTKNAVSIINAFGVEEGLDPYINLIVKSIVYGPIQVVDQTLTTYEYIIDYTEKSALENYVLKLVGPLIRVAFYKYENEVKGRVVSTILKFEEKGLSLAMFLPQLQTTFVRMITDYHGDKNYLSTICDGIKYVIDNSKKRDLLLNDLVSKYLTADNSVRKFAYIFCIYKVVKKNIKAFSKAVLDKMSEKLLEIKDLNIGSDQNKYIGRIFGYLASLEVINKQKDVLTAYFDKLDNVNDKEYLIFERFMSTLIFCDPKVLEAFDAAQLEKKINNSMKVIKAKYNVLYALQDLKKLKDSNDKTKSTVGQAVIDHNNFREMYPNLTREEEIEEILSML